MINVSDVENRIKLLGLKKSHVAERINISPSRLSHYLKERIEIPSEIETKLKSYLGL